MESLQAKGNGPFIIKCQMIENCIEEVTHIDQRGFIYCACHGYTRRVSGTPCRKMTKKELKFINAGQPLEKY